MCLKKTLEILGLSILICFSFILTENTSKLMKDNDEIMINLKGVSKNYEVLSIDAKIDDDEIIPGIKGKTVDLEKSYQVMKKIGTYNNSLIIYKEVIPTVSINDNYDKYVVSGNDNKNMVSLILKIDDNTNIDSIINLIESKNIDVNFFVTNAWSENNIEILKKISEKYVIGNLELYNVKNCVIKKTIVQKNYYCYSENKNELLLNECSSNKMYTILPSLVINKNLLSKVKKEISNGSIISIEVNANTLKELANTIDYINSKGYKIVNLDTLLEE